MKKIVTCLLAIVGLMVSCKQKYDSVDVNEFLGLIAMPDVMMLDVRSAEEYAEGHIKDAINIDQSQADFVQIVQSKISPLTTIAVYCRSGRRSASAAARLAAVGYKVVNLKGGIMAWKAASMIVTTEVEDSNRAEEFEAPEPPTVSEPTPLPSHSSSSSYSGSSSSSSDNMRGFDPASEDDMDDNGMSRYMENNDDEGWD